MAPAAHSDRRLTYDDFLLFPDCDGLRHEIIDGVHYETAAPNLRHQDLIGRLYLAMGNFLAAHHGLGRVFLSPVDVIFTLHDIVEPERSQLIVHRRDGPRLTDRTPLLADTDAVLTSPLLPGFSLSISELFKPLT